MDFQNRVGNKFGSGHIGQDEANIDRRERLRKLAMETIDLAKDPYFFRNNIGSYECKLCLTLHNNEGSYFVHTQGKKHQEYLRRRAAKEAKEAVPLPQPTAERVQFKKFAKIGRPGYKVIKEKDPMTGQHALFFQVDYPEIAEAVRPRHRFMSAYEQKVEAPDKDWQYLLLAAEPYETIAFKIPSRDVDQSEGKFFWEWNPDTKQFFIQVPFKPSQQQLQRLQAQAQAEYDAKEQGKNSELPQPPKPPSMPQPPVRPGMPQPPQMPQPPRPPSGRPPMRITVPHANPLNPYAKPS